MSRTPMAPGAVSTVPVDHLPEPPGLELSDVPSIRGKDGAMAWFRDELGVPVGIRLVKESTENHTLPSYIIGGAVYYSSRDLWRWLATRRRSAVTR